MTHMPGILVHHKWEDHRIAHDMEDDLLQLYCRDGGGWKACLRPKSRHQIYMRDIAAILESESPKEICVVGLQGGGWKTVWAITPKEVTYPGRPLNERAAAEYKWRIEVRSRHGGKDLINMQWAVPMATTYSSLEGAREAVETIVYGRHLDPSKYKTALAISSSFVRLRKPEPFEIYAIATIFKIDINTQEESFGEILAYGLPTGAS